MKFPAFVSYHIYCRKEKDIAMQGFPILCSASLDEFLHVRETVHIWLNVLLIHLRLHVCETDEALTCTVRASLSSCVQSSPKPLSGQEDNISSQREGAPWRIYFPGLPISTVLASTVTFTKCTAASLGDIQNR